MVCSTFRTIGILTNVSGTPYLYGYSPAPCVMADPKGNVASVMVCFPNDESTSPMLTPFLERGFGQKDRKDASLAVRGAWIPSRRCASATERQGHQGICRPQHTVSVVVYRESGPYGTTHETRRNRRDCMSPIPAIRKSSTNSLLVGRRPWKAAVHW